MYNAPRILCSLAIALGIAGCAEMHIKLPVSLHRLTRRSARVAIDNEGDIPPLEGVPGQKGCAALAWLGCVVYVPALGAIKDAGHPIGAEPPT